MANILGAQTPAWEVSPQTDLCSEAGNGRNSRKANAHFGLDNP
jgi:hypothetical protein